MNIHKLIVDLADHNVGSLMYDTDQNGELIASEDGQEIFLEECKEIETILESHGITCNCLCSTETEGGTK